MDVQMLTKHLNESYALMRTALRPNKARLRNPNRSPLAPAGLLQYIHVQTLDRPLQTSNTACRYDIVEI